MGGGGGCSDGAAGGGGHIGGDGGRGLGGGNGGALSLRTAFELVTEGLDNTCSSAALRQLCMCTLHVMVLTYRCVWVHGWSGANLNQADGTTMDDTPGYATLSMMPAFPVACIPTRVCSCVPGKHPHQLHRRQELEGAARGQTQGISLCSGERMQEQHVGSAPECSRSLSCGCQA